MSAVAAVDRFLDALRSYFTDDIDAEFNATAGEIYSPNPFTWTSVDSGAKTVDGDPIFDMVMTTNEPKPADPRAAVRQYIDTHSRAALARPWGALREDPGFAALPQDARDEFEAAVGKVLDVFAAQNPGVMAWTVAPGNNIFGTQIEAARAVVYRAANANPAHSDVAAATQALAEAQAECDAAVAALHAAIESSDLGRISELRPVATVELPAKVDRAKLALLDAEAAVAAAECAPFVERQARVEKAADDAALAVEKARQALANAEARKVAADNLLPATSEATTTAQQRAEHAAAVRDAHAVNLEAARLHRVRTFAGV